MPGRIGGFAFIQAEKSSSLQGEGAPRTVPQGCCLPHSVPLTLPAAAWAVPVQGPAAPLLKCREAKALPWLLGQSHSKGAALHAPGHSHTSLGSCLWFASPIPCSDLCCCWLQLYFCGWRACLVAAGCASHPAGSQDLHSLKNLPPSPS